MPVQFRTIKQEVLAGYKRHNYASGTVPTQGGSTTIFYDNNRQESDRFWSLDGANTWLKMTASGNNDGLVRRVTGFSTGNFSLTVAPALTASVASGNTYTLFKGPHPDNDIGQGINETLRSTFPERRVSAVATLNEQEEVRSYTVPTAVMNAVTVLRLVERSVGTTSSEYQYEPLILGQDYKVWDTGGAGRLELQYIPVASQVLRFTGERIVADLSADTDTTDEPLAVILAGARHWLALQEGNKDLASYWERKFEEAKRDYQKRMPAVRLTVPVIKVP